MPITAAAQAPLLNNARYGIAWGALGAAETCWHTARDYVMDRKQFDRPLGSNQIIQLKLADMQTDISIGLQGCYRAGQLMNDNNISPESVMIRKVDLSKCLRIMSFLEPQRHSSVM